MVTTRSRGVDKAADTKRAASAQPEADDADAPRPSKSAKHEEPASDGKPEAADDEPEEAADRPDVGAKADDGDEAEATLVRSSGCPPC